MFRKKETMKIKHLKDKDRFEAVIEGYRDFVEYVVHDGTLLLYIPLFRCRLGDVESQANR